MDFTHVNNWTYTNITIRPRQYTDEDGITHVDFRVEISVDSMITGRGSGRSLGAAIVACGLDMMGIEADLLIATMDLVRKYQQ